VLPFTLPTPQTQIKAKRLIQPLALTLSTTKTPRPQPIGLAISLPSTQAPRSQSDEISVSFSVSTSTTEKVLNEPVALATEAWQARFEYPAAEREGERESQGGKC
jgi:hypothetical protein